MRYLKKLGREVSWPWFKYTMIFIIVVFIIPLCINECYNRSGFIETLWDAKDVLVFYGTIVAACGTLYGVYLSLKNTQDRYLEDSVRKIRPFMLLSIYDIHREYNFKVLIEEFQKEAIKKRCAITDESNENLDVGVLYKEFIEHDFYLIVGDEEIKFTNRLNESQKEMVLTNYKMHLIDPKSPEAAYFVKLRVENGGLGAARLVTVYMRNGSVVGNTEARNVGVGNYVNLGLFFPIASNKRFNNCNWLLTFAYKDINGKPYCQDVNLKTSISDNGGPNFQITELN